MGYRLQLLLLIGALIGTVNLSDRKAKAQGISLCLFAVQKKGKMEKRAAGKGRFGDIEGRGKAIRKLL